MQLSDAVPSDPIWARRQIQVRRLEIKSVGYYGTSSSESNPHTFGLDKIRGLAELQMYVPMLGESRREELGGIK